MKNCWTTLPCGRPQPAFMASFKLHILKMNEGDCSGSHSHVAPNQKIVLVGKLNKCHRLIILEKCFKWKLLSH